MANILILAKDIPFPLDSGSALRVFPPCRHLAQQHTLVLVAFGEPNRHLEALKLQGVFKQITLLAKPEGRRMFWRHLRLSDRHFIKLSNPKYYHETVRLLKAQVQYHQIDLVLIFPSILMEFTEPLRHVRKIADSCDCITLTYERLYQYQKNSLSLRQRLDAWVRLRRYKQFEKNLTRNLDAVVSISPPDQERLIHLNRHLTHKIEIIPNGVSETLLNRSGSAPEIDRAVIFWGALDFVPNHSAIVFFYEKVYAPILHAENVQWFIIGRNADDTILNMAEKHPNIIITGYIEDLYDLVGRVPIMINPMLTGSGMKNKVLEAFALRRMVVSTRLGVDAIPEAKPGVHYAPAERPEDFAGTILYHLNHPSARRNFGDNAQRLIKEKYTWRQVGGKWSDLVTKHLPAHS